jgi:phosphoglycerate kinase
MERELKALTKAAENPEKPCIYILGGAKADDALKISQYVLKNNIADRVLTGGVVGHLFLAARGFDLGKPNMEFLQKKELMGFIPGIEKLIEECLDRIEVPIDVAIEVNKKRKEILTKQLPTDYPIFDIGTSTIERYSKIIRNSKSIVFSGPVGVFENKEFEVGTKKIFEAIASSKAYSLIGGGDTISVAEKFGMTQKMGYVSTAGGALIEFLMGEKLPGVVALEEAAART